MFTSWFGDDEATGQTSSSAGDGADDERFVATTGYWSQYYGNVREIVAETLLRAGEVSLGFARPDHGSAAARRASGTGRSTSSGSAASRGSRAG